MTGPEVNQVWVLQSTLVSLTVPLSLPFPGFFPCPHPQVPLSQSWGSIDFLFKRELDIISASETQTCDALVMKRQVRVGDLETRELCLESLQIRPDWISPAQCAMRLACSVGLPQEKSQFYFYYVKRQPGKI